MTNEKTIQVKKAVTAISETSNGHWVSVKDKSLTSICNYHGLDSVWTAAVVKALRESGFAMVEGWASGMRYKMPTDYILDMSALIKKVDEFYTNRKKTSASDLQLKVVKEKTEKGGEAVKVKRRTHFDIDRKAFWLDLRDGLIKEVEIIGVEKKYVIDEDDDSDSTIKEDDIIYFHKIKIQQGVNKEDVKNNKLFETVEQLVACLVKTSIKIK